MMLYWGLVHDSTGDGHHIREVGRGHEKKKLGTLELRKFYPLCHFVDMLAQPSGNFQWNIGSRAPFEITVFSRLTQEDRELGFYFPRSSTRFQVRFLSSMRAHDGSNRQ